MLWKKICTVLLGSILLVCASLALTGADNEGSLYQAMLEENVLVEDLAVNGESDEVTVGMDQSVTVTATVTNNGDETVDVPLVIAWDDQVDEGHKGYVLEGLEPGDTEEIEWTREQHATWMPNEYTVSVGEESVSVTVGDPVDEENGLTLGSAEIRIIGGLIITAFILGIAVGALWMKKS